MTTDERLREHAEFLLKSARKEIEAGEEVWPKAHIIGADDAISVILIDPAMMATSASKDALVAKIKTLCDDLHAKGVVFLSDIWTTVMSKEQTAKRRAIEQMLGYSMGIPELAASGLCSKREALMVVIHHGRLGTKTIIREHYMRGKDKTQVLWEDRTEDTAENAGGRMLDWM